MEHLKLGKYFRLLFLAYQVFSEKTQHEREIALLSAFFQRILTPFSPALRRL